MRKDQHLDYLTEVFDKTAAICKTNRQTLRSIVNQIEFMSNNPLPKFIPKTKLFNGRNYQDYENEYMMYYNIYKNAKGDD